MNLRSLRDSNKYQISYLTFTRDELPALCDTPETEEFYELLQTHVLWLAPYSYEDAWVEITRIASRYRVTPERSLGDRLIHLAGPIPVYSSQLTYLL